MAQTLEEFLINVRYNIDAPSQQRFFDTLKKVATSASGVAGEITGIGVAILKLSEIMATAGEKLYWMSQRIGDSVTSIESATFALSNLGESAAQAGANIERFGAWTRSMGPAATMYLRTLGVTATDTIGRMNQLAQYFRNNAAQPGSLEYALNMRRASMVGLDEMTMRAMMSGQFQEGQKQAGIMQRLVWGSEWKTGPQQFADQSLKVMNQFRTMGFFFTNLSQQFGLGLFNAILPHLQKINDLLVKILPDIQGFLNHIISYAPAAMTWLEHMISGFGGFLQLLSAGMEALDKMPDRIKLVAEIVGGGALGFKLLMSPLGMVIAGFTALMYLLDDYQHFQKDPHTAALNWNKIADFMKPFKEGYEAVDSWLSKLTGICHVLDYISGAAVIGGLDLIMHKLDGVAGKFFSMGRFLLTNPVGMAVMAAMGIGIGIHEAESKENTELSKKLFGDDSATSLGKALFASTMADMAGVPVEEWIKKNFPQWLDKSEKMPGAKARPGAGPDYSGLPNPEGVAPPVQGPSYNFGNTGIGRFFHRLLDWPGSNNRQKNRGMGGGGGGYQLASLGDDWMVPKGFGGTDAAADDEIGARMRAVFEGMLDKLSDILDTLLAMADHMGIDPSNLPGGGGGGDGGADGDFGPMLPPHASAEEQEARLRQIEYRESHGQNILNRMGPGGSPASTASGYYQMLDSTWQHAARLAGIDTGRYPRAINAPWALQHAAAMALINEQGEKPWATSRPHLAHVPLGADGSGGGGGGAPSWYHPMSRGDIHNETHISVVAPNPGSAAMQVADHQTRIFENHIRYAKGAIPA